MGRTKRFRRWRNLIQEQGYIHRREGAIGLPCPYCGVKMTDHVPGGGKVTRDTATRDHVRPRCEGGKRVVIVCNACNHEKADRGPLTWLLHLMQTGQLERARITHRTYSRMGGILPPGLTLEQIVASAALLDNSMEPQPPPTGESSHVPE